MYKTILDVDTGVDDALALLLAMASPELDIIGVTCVAGNTTIDHVVYNTLALLRLAGREDIPVAIGARKPLMGALRTASYFHGENGLAGITLQPSSSLPVAEDAASFLSRIVREHAGEVTIVALGPLTNIALAILRDATFASNVKQLVVMGGAITAPGNASGAAEANFHNDPEAAAAVVSSGIRPGIVDLGATIHASYPFDAIPEDANSDVQSTAGLTVSLLRFYGARYRSAGAPGIILHDPLAVGLAALPHLGQFVPLHVAIETAGEHTRGASIGSYSTQVPVEMWVDDHWDVRGLQDRAHNASVARHVDGAAFVQVFVERLGLKR